MKHDDLAQKLEVLRQNYNNALPDRLSDIEQRWERINKQWNDVLALELLKTCHTLAGGAATFGLPKITEQAHIIEQHLNSIETGVIPSKEKLATINKAVHSLLMEPAKTEVELPDFLPRQPVISLSERPIYIVDDDVDFGEQLKIKLQKHNYDVKVFQNIAQFEAGLAEQEPGIILMDMILTENKHSGAKEIIKLRENQLLKSPVCFISISEDIQSRLAAFRAGGNAYFVKPIDMNALVDKISLLTGNNKDQQYRILFLDDDKLLGKHYEEIFRSIGCVSKSVSQPLDIMKHLVDFKPDVLLIDVHMPDCNGIELAGTLRQQDAYIHLPIIFLSREINVHKQFSAREVGGDDFLVKPINEQHLVTAVLNRAQRARQMFDLTYKDSMTRLLNHDKLEDELKREIYFSQRIKSPLAFVLFNLDHFKSVNEDYGHLAGDKVIKCFASVLIERQRHSDLVGRYNGTKFGLILPDTSLDKVDNLLNEILNSFAAITHQHNQHLFKVTASAGVAAYNKPMTAKQLIDNASKQLKKAKENDRNKIFIEPTTDDIK